MPGISESTVTKIFKPKDVFYNNGIVNLKISFEESNDKPGLECHIGNSELALIFDKKYENNLYESILGDLIKKNKIVFQTDNERWYWDNQAKDFTKDNKYDVKGKASGNDVLHGVYSYINAEEIDLEPEQLYNKFKEFCKKNNMKDKEAESLFFDKKTGKIKSKDKIKLLLYITKEKAIDNFSHYLAGDSNLTFDSKIHQFEDGGHCFRDMLVYKNNTIDRWDALIYWYGSRIQRFYNSSYYIYINSHNLKSFKVFKKSLKINEDQITRRAEKTGELVPLPTNVDMHEQLKLDNIKNENFYIVKSEQEFKLKFFMWLFSYIYHIEDNYKNSLDERKKLKRKELLDSIKDLSFVTYTEDGSMKSGLNEYTKTYRLFKLFESLIAYKKDEVYLFKYLADLIDTISLSKSQKEMNLNIRQFSDNMLNFKPLRKNYYEASYDILKNDKRSFGKGLQFFENEYLTFLRRGDREMKLHENSKKLGDEIGAFAANVEDKDLLFRLRNVKNHFQLVSYFKTVKFASLKIQNDQKPKYIFTREFNELLDELLVFLEEEDKYWELVRDYIAIYAIDKYKSVAFAKNQKGGN